MRYNVTIEFETDYEGEVTFDDVQKLLDEGLLDGAKVVELTPNRKDNEEGNQCAKNGSI